MLRASALRLSCARTAAESLSGDLDPGVQSLIVAGSAARGEAVAASDVDFNAFMTEPYMQTLHSRRDRKAATPHELLRNYEQKLRSSLETGLKERLGAAGFDTGSGRLTIKPFSQISSSIPRAPARSPTPPQSAVRRDFRCLVWMPSIPSWRWCLPALRPDRTPCWAASSSFAAGTPPSTASPGCLRRPPGRFGRWNRFRRRTRSPRVSRPSSRPPSATAILEMPYWCTFDEAAAIVEPEVRGGLELFVAWVTLARSGAIDVNVDVMSELLETALGALPIALDAIIDHLAAHGTPDEILEGWDWCRTTCRIPRWPAIWRTNWGYASRALARLSLRAGTLVRELCSTPFSSHCSDFNSQ